VVSAGDKALVDSAAATVRYGCADSERFAWRDDAALGVRARCRAAHGAVEPSPPCGRPSLTRKARLQPAVPAPLFTVPRLPAIAKDAPTFRRVEGFHSHLTHQWPSLCEFLRRAVRSTIPVLKTRFWQATPPAPLFFSWSVASSPFAAKNSLRDGT